VIEGMCMSRVAMCLGRVKPERCVQEHKMIYRGDERETKKKEDYQRRSYSADYIRT